MFSGGDTFCVSLSLSRIANPDGLIMYLCDEPTILSIEFDWTIRNLVFM